MNHTTLDGPDSLRDQGITDGAFLDLAENDGNQLSFVHVVVEKEGEKENEKPGSSGKPKAHGLGSEREDSEDQYESSSEEEF